MNTNIEYQTIVDLNDIVIGKKVRSEIKPNDIFRIASVWFIDKEGNLLLGKRSTSKKNDPGKITTLVNGTVSFNDSYEQTAIREIEEEVGYKTSVITPIIKLRIQRPDHHFYVQYFKTVINQDTKLNPDPSEISELIWFTKAELKEMIENKPELFVPKAQEIFAQILPIL